MLQKLNSLRTRITLLLLAFGAAIAAVFVCALLYAQTQRDDELRQHQGNQFAANVVALYPNLAKFSTLDAAETEARFAQLLQLEPASAMYVLDDIGRVLAGHSKQSGGKRAPSVSLAPIEALLSQPAAPATWGDDPDFPGKQGLFAAAPLHESGGKTGYLYALMRPLEANTGQAWITSHASRTALAVAAGATLLLALLAWALLKRLTRPLTQLTAAADALKNAGTERSAAMRLPHAGRADEVGALARAFESLRARLTDSAERSKRTDTTQRDWVANVSQNLRAPLASLIGHLESVQVRGEQMPPAQRSQLIDTALQNAKQVDALSSSLLDFARLESDDALLSKTPTPMGELLNQLSAGFALRAQKRGVQLVCDAPSTLALVLVDNSLIERAITDLVDNALRHTPAGGTIRLGAQDSKRWLMVSVSDTGPGIHLSDLQHAFEARGSLGNAGLGLAMVQRIAHLHGGHVSVQNRPAAVGGGAKFIIALPRTGAKAQSETA